MKLRIFIAEDEPEVRSLLALLVTRCGHEAISFPGPIGFLKFIRDAGPIPADEDVCDILITDYNMPHMNGTKWLST